MAYQLATGAPDRGIAPLGPPLIVVAGDGTVQLPPAMLENYPPGTLFTVDDVEGTVMLEAERPA